ncbi:MAG TPA: bifunctional phosphopantothenoylcysteine decarboxylase/phosphopantothenate--cysteine ligase CoaBC [Sphingomicrobium sp.]|nr:bifunctional phosphopantothenoylcysteine decarboxylase/phosphopantothenate--cysteine ligase CoaBC [Sphingomicrobium sp.]
MSRVLLIVGGGIAAYKASELIRLLRKSGHQVTPVLTAGGAHFVTPMTLAALAESPVYTSLWDLKDEAEMGHIQLSRAADLILVCPATADLIAKMAAGIADDLATTLLLATDKPVVIAPAMNVRMWQHAATSRNIDRLKADGIIVIDPDEGDMACGEYGPGRLPEPADIMTRIAPMLTGSVALGAVDPGKLVGKHVLVTAGPTHEPIDPVRVIANRSSGKQGFAIAAAAAMAGARVTLIAGPVALPTPGGVVRIDVETAVQMAAAVEAALPADVAILVAAVADWRVEASAVKLKKSAGPPQLRFEANPDILTTLAKHPLRPALLIGFAAETSDVIANATAKLAKGADWILANDVSGDVMGGSRNRVHLISAAGIEEGAEYDKNEIARLLIDRIIKELA